MKTYDTTKVHLHEKQQTTKPYIRDSDFNPHVSWGSHLITPNRVLAVAAIGLILAGVGLAGCTGAVKTNQTVANDRVVTERINDNDLGALYRSVYCEDRLICYERMVYSGYALSCPDRPDLVEKYCGPLNNQTK